jgi:hypothetical protein
LNDDEALCFKGFKKYFLTDGYRQNITFLGKNTRKYRESALYDAKECIVSIDAINFEKN